MRVKGISDVSQVKRDIQDTVRDIVILREGGCIARNEPWHKCSSQATKDGHLVLQADHLITRGNSATYADTRLIVCICQGLHAWKKWNEKEYNERIRPLLSKERQDLWDRAHADRYKPARTGLYDWKLQLVALKQEHKTLLEQL